MTEAEVKAEQRRVMALQGKAGGRVGRGSGVLARGRTKPAVAGRMNGLEAEYAAHLDFRASLGEVARWDFQPIKLRLADLTWYSPDFRVLLRDGTEEMHEVKGGHWEEDARVKIKVAAELHPYRFLAVTRPRVGRGKRGRGAWVVEEI